MLARPFGPTGVPVSVIGQGTWHMGEDKRIRKDEVATLRLGIELGLTHIDTAEMCAHGRVEEIVGEPPVVGSPAAISGAVRDATGHRFTDLPITSEAVRRALGVDAHP